MTTNEKLKELRINKKMTQQDVADSLGISKGLVSLCESGKRMPGRKTLLKFADLFGVPIDYLVRREEKADPSDIFKPKRSSVGILRESSASYKSLPIIPMYETVSELSSQRPSSYADENNLLAPYSDDEMFYLKLSDGGWALGRAAEKISKNKKYILNNKTPEVVDGIAAKRQDVLGELVSITYIF